MLKYFKKFFPILIILILTAFFISCPNDQMRDLIEIKVSDPVADTFIINDGNPTNSRSVTLFSGVSKDKDALEMRFRNAGFSWSEWETYSSSKTWTLPTGDGIKTVYAEYRDEGHHTVSMTNIIDLDTGAPAGPGFYVWGTGTEAGQIHDYVNSRNCTLFINVAGADRMRFSNSSTGNTIAEWDAVTPVINYSDSYSWTLSAGDGSKTVYSQFIDPANNVTDPPFTYTIELDETSPSASGFTINSDAAVASNTAVTLTYNYTENNAVWAEYRNDGESWSGRNSLSGGSESANWTLKSEVGTRTVYVRLKDIAGNEAVFSDQIYLDNAAPGVPVVSVNAVSYTYTPVWSWTSGGGGSGDFRYKLDDNNFSSGYTETTSTSYTPASDLSAGNHTLYVQEKDSAGNWSDSGSAETVIDDSFSLSVSVSPGGSGSTDPVTTTATLNIAENIDATPAAGYDFSHWQLISGSGVSFTNANNANTQITLSAGDAAIQAVFTPKTYTALFNKQGGSGGSNSVTATFNAPMPAATAPTRQGYTFNGYFTGTDGVGIQFYDGNMNSVNNWTLVSGVWLYAKWTVNNYIVTFDKQGGSGGSNSVTVTYDSSMPSAAAPAKPGFTFGGYYSGLNGTGTQYYNSSMTSVTNWNISSNTTIYAKWNYIVYALRSTGPAGGLIFYENPSWATDGWRYLEAAPVSTEWSGIQWGKYGTEIGGTSTDIGTGPSNTQAVVTGLAQPPAETGRAAQWCNSLGYNGLYDWFLPSRSEGYEMIRQLFAYDLGGFKSAAFPGVFYWTSSESGTTGQYANVIQVITGPDYDYDDHPKDNSAGYDYYVRAIRRF